MVDCKNDVQQASSNAAIFELVKPYMSFLNPELLAHIIEFLGSDNDRKNFKDYMKALEEYCKVTQALLPDQIGEMPESEMAFQQVHVVMEISAMSLKSVQSFKSKMAKILKLNVAALQFKTAGGSPLAISFKVPNFACEKVFPLSCEQERELKALGALSLECGEYSYGYCQISAPQVIDQDEMEIPSLGRPFCLGMFYDCRNDNLLLGIRLCKDDVIEAVLEEQPQVSHSCEVLEEDSLETKALSLQLTNPLRLSLLSNLVHDNSKSAKYWNDRCKSKRQVRVCLKYTSTTCKKQIPLNKLGEIQHHVFDRATHVVTGVLFGLEAYCVFDHMLRENERFEDVHKNMVTMVKTLATSDSNEAYINDHTIGDCKVYNDIEQTCTLQEIVDLFRKLPSLSADEKPTLIPKRVWLYPLKKLDNRCNTVVRQVSSDLVNQVQSILEYLRDVEIHGNDLLNKHSVTFSRFQHTENRVTKFTEVIATYRNHLKKKTAKLLPHVREGAVEENELAKTIQENSVSPFKFETITSWLEQVEEEISVLEMIMHQVNNVDFISSRELESNTSEERDSDYLVCFAFHVALEDDTFIHLLQQDDGVDQHRDSLHKSSQPLKWYTNTELMKKITSNIEHFKTFMENNSKNKSTRFVVTNYASNTGVALNEPNSASILLYEGTTCKVWEPPGPPGKPTTKEITNNSVQLEWSKPEYGSQSVECYQVSYHPVANPQGGSVVTTNSAQVMATVSGLTAGTKYVFTIQSKCKVGVGSRGDTSAPIETGVASSVLDGAEIDKQTSSNKTIHTTDKSGRHLSSIPTSDNTTMSLVVLGKPTATATTHNSIALDWECSSDDVDFYIVSYHPVDGSPKKWKKITTKSSEQSQLVSELSPQTKYIFKVRPELQDSIGAWSELSDPIETKAPLCQPGKPTASAVTSDSITVQWNKPEYGCENVESYFVRYRCTDDPTKKWEKELTDSTETKLTVTKLTPKTKYIFKVRPELEVGVGAESEVSDPIETKVVQNSYASSAGIGKPTATRVTHDSISMHWKKPDHENIESYFVSYRSVDTQSKTWIKKFTESSQENLTVMGLAPKTTYIFKVQPVLDDGFGAESEVSEPIETKKRFSHFNKPMASIVTHNSVQLKLTKLENGTEGTECYTVCYQVADNIDNWQQQTIDNVQEHVTVEGLERNMKYIFKICSKDGSESGPESEVSDPIQTKVTSSPGKPTVSAVSHTSITVKWSQPKLGTEDIKSYSVYYFLSKQNKKKGQMSTTHEEATISSLTPLETYVVEVQPICKNGAGTQSEPSEPIQTKAPLCQPGKPTASAVTSDSITVQWNKPEHGCENVESYFVRYRCTDDPTKKWGRVFTDSTETKLTITKLTPKTTYIFKVRPVLNDGFGTESEVSEPIETKKRFSHFNKPMASVVTHNSVQLKLTKLENGTEGTECYTVCYQLADNIDNWQQQTIDNVQEHVTVEGLERNMKYIFKICSKDGSESGPESEVSDPIQTKVTSSPGKPTVSAVTHTSITVKWSQPKLGTEDIKSYSVYYFLSKQSKKKGQMSTTHEEATISSLTPLETYVVEVQPICKNGVGTQSEPSEPIQTKAPLCQPGKPTASAVTSDSITVQWNKPEYGCENVESHLVRYRCTDDPTKKGEMEFTDSTETKLTVTKLTPKTKYIFKVRPELEVGVGAESEVSEPIETKKRFSHFNKPMASIVTHNSVQLKLTKLENGTEGTECYTVSYQLADNIDNWQQQTIDNVQEHVTVEGLERNMKYIFKICSKDGSESGPESEVSDPIQTKVTSSPGKPTVSAVTHTSITVKWSQPKLGTEDIKSYSVYYFLSKQSKKKGQMSTTHEEATISSLTPLETVAYVVVVQPICKNGVGTQSEPSEPIQTKATSPPGKPVSTNVTHNSVTLEWDAPDYCSENIDCYTICYHSSHNPSNQWEFKQSNSTKLIIPDLNYNTEYVFKIHPECKSGTGSESRLSKPIKTNPASPSGKPTASTVTHNSIKLSWSKPEHGSGNGTNYHILKCKRNLPDKWDVEKTSSMSTELEVKCLEPKTEYLFKVKLICQTGESDESEVSEPIETKPVCKPGKPYAIKVTCDKIYLVWEIPEHYCESIESYTIVTGKENKSKRTQIKKAQSHPLKTESCTIFKLNAGAGYMFKVVPTGSDVHGIYTESEPSDVIVTKFTSPPGKPKIDDVTNDTARVTWTHPTNGKVNILYYTVRYRPVTDPTIDWKDQDTSGPQTHQVITGLSEKTKYMFTVIPKCKDGKEGTESETSDPTEIFVTSPPGTPEATEKTHEKISLKWTPPDSGMENVQSYTVFYKQLEYDQWHDQTTGDTGEHMIIRGLETNKYYIFKVQAICKQGCGIGAVSKESKAILASKCCKTGKPKASAVTHDSIQLDWDKPHYEYESVVCYEISYRTRNSTSWTTTTTAGRHESLNLIGLSPNTDYIFNLKVQPVCEGTDIHTPFCTSDFITTLDKPLAEHMLAKCSRSDCIVPAGSDGQDRIPMWRVPQGMIDPNNRIAKYHYGTHSAGTPGKVIMLVGAIGAGKSTLINSIANYILGVGWETQFRFKLIEHENISQAHSQTSWITAYTFHAQKGSPIKYDLTIVDTPGFGDSRGIERDKEITRHIKHFFSVKPPNEIDVIHGIGIVAQAALVRLTPTQKYVFDSIFSMFGKDIADNIFLMSTFADGQPPQVLATIEAANIKCNECFKFNNSVLYESTNTGGQFGQLFWEMNEGSIRSFFSILETTEAISLQLTKEVLQKREHLRTLIQKLQQKVELGLHLIQEVQQEQKIIKHHMTGVFDPNFIYQVEVPKTREVKLPEGTYATNCIQCNFTCHYPCTISDDRNIYSCSAMGGYWMFRNKDSKCKNCPGNCHWKQHKQNGFVIEIYQDKETRTLKDLMERYLEPTGSEDDDLSVTDEMISSAASKLKELNTEVMDLIRETQQCINRLQEIAYKRHPLNELAYIESMIESEKREAKDGFEARISALEELKEQAELLSQLGPSQGANVETSTSRNPISWYLGRLIMQCTTK